MGTNTDTTQRDHIVAMLLELQRSHANCGQSDAVDVLAETIHFLNGQCGPKEPVTLEVIRVESDCIVNGRKIKKGTIVEVKRSPATSGSA